MPRATLSSYSLQTGPHMLSVVTPGESETLLRVYGGTRLSPWLPH